MGINSLSSLKLIKNNCMFKTVQCKKHKNKRINKKWRKRYGCRQIPDGKIYLYNNSIIAHPEIIDKIAEQLGK